MYLTVGEISKALGISTEAIRYYVKEGIITPKRNEENNYWVYSSDDLMKLTDIMFYRSMGLTMKDIKDIMSGLALSEKILKTRKMSMLGTWILGIIVCVDDYLNCLAVSAAVRKITDNEKVSREMLAYIINSTGVTVCAIIPFSSWAAFMGGLMEKSDMLGGYSVSGAYIHTIPFMLYGWLAVICVPLFILKVIPLFGPMKKSEERALTAGEVFSPEAKA
ncbi:MAG: MerR family transcriptional regulator [Emergencia sp.]|nr:MerR family transcriptional regulator [Emergencia sp.]